MKTGNGTLADRVCLHCGYSIHIAKHGEFVGKYVHVLTGNWLCALSAAPADEPYNEIEWGY
jgi:hypothetical protein